MENTPDGFNSCKPARVVDQAINWLAFAPRNFFLAGADNPWLGISHLEQIRVYLVA